MPTRENTAPTTRRARVRVDKGFTLVELLVVVIVVGILAAIAVPAYLGIQNNARNASVQTDLQNAKSAVVSVENGTGGVLPTANSDVSHVVTQNDGYTKGEYTGTIGYATGTPSTFNFCLRSTVVNGDGSEYFIMDTGGVQKVAGSTLLPAGC